MIRLLLVDDHESSRVPLAFLLNHQPDLTVVGEASTLAEAHTRLSGVDVALLDLDLPDGDGATLIHDLRLVNPGAVSIVLTGSQSRIDHARAIEQGACGVFYKAIPASDLISAIRRVHAGGMLHTPAEIAAFLQLAKEHRILNAERAQMLAQLTPRERELLQALADGLSNDEIAERLYISVRTVQSHMLRLFDKLGTDSRLQSLIIALRYGIVQIT